MVRGERLADTAKLVKEQKRRRIGNSAGAGAEKKRFLLEFEKGAQVGSPEGEGATSLPVTAFTHPPTPSRQGRGGCVPVTDEMNPGKPEYHTKKRGPGDLPEPAAGKVIFLQPPGPVDPAAFFSALNRSWRSRSAGSPPRLYLPGAR
ncbi:hypothetical protein GMST_25200 [Geomonas silvestris]|uniref:Uncharacterized protein n=1 Tax=Geomonas silvestris TaxID=2740184 RepID=A0A6V8MJJ7_9BACT|nr:hypothetical protein GMST_25200 [Geomonas silvestris]